MKYKEVFCIYRLDHVERKVSLLLYCTDVQKDDEKNIKQHPFLLALTNYKGEFFLPFKYMEEKLADFVKLNDIIVNYATHIAKNFFNLEYDFYFSEDFNMNTYFIEQKNIIEHLVSLNVKTSLANNIIANNLNEIKNHFITKVPISNRTVIVDSDEHIGGTKFEKRISTDAFDFQNYRKEQFKEIFKDLL